MVPETHTETQQNGIENKQMYNTIMRKKMKKNIRTLAALLIASATLAACSSDDSIAEQQPVNPTAPKTYTMTVQATKTTGGDAQTRGLYYGDADAQGKKPLNVKWNEGEKVEVVQGSATLGTLTATPDSSDPTKATLSGTLTSSPADDQPILFALHGAQADYTGQKGILLKTDGDDSIEENYDYAACQVEKDKFTIDTDAKTVSVPDGITLISAQAIVKFSLYKSDGITPINATSLAISSSPSVFATVYKISTHYVENSITCGNIELTGLSGTTNDIYVALCTIFSANAGITLTATDASGNTYTYTKSGVTFAIGQYYEVKVKMKNTAPLTVEAVDLGLSVKWATMNVGAESVTDRGLYFAWGETTGHAFGSGYEFLLDNYAWYNSTDLYTKYKHDGSSWDYEELASEDDAATQNWGGAWRMPTKAEWEELLNEDNCTWTWTTDYKGDGSNVAGVIVTSKKDGYTDKSIFLPATGIYKNGNNNAGSEIYATYWSKSLDTDSYKYLGFAWKLEILYNEGSLYYRQVHNEYRYYGIGVRAVRE